MRSFIEIMSLMTSDTYDILDIGCGDKNLHFYIKYKNIVTVDAWDKVNPDFLIDLETNDLPFEENTFDIILMIDVIEHLSRERGIEIINQSKRIAKKCIILLTPLKFSTNQENTNDSSKWCYNNIYNYHKSLWGEKDFRDWFRFIDVERYLIDDYFFGVWYK